MMLAHLTGLSDLQKPVGGFRGGSPPARDARGNSAVSDKIVSFVAFP
jgi:hypothetical protein